MAQKGGSTAGEQSQADSLHQCPAASSHASVGEARLEGSSEAADVSAPAQRSVPTCFLVFHLLLSCTLTLHPILNQHRYGKLKRRWWSLAPRACRIVCFFGGTEESLNIINIESKNAGLGQFSELPK